MKKITSLVVALMMITTLSVSFASANLYDDKENIESEIEKQEEKVNEIEQKEAEVQSSITEVVEKKRTLMKRIEKTEVDIVKKESELEKIQMELQRAIQKIKKQEEEFASRVKADYEKRNQTTIEVFLTSDGLSDFMNRLDFAKVIAKQDKEMLDSFKAEKEKVKKLQEIEKNNLEALNTLKENQIKDKEELVAVEKELKARAAELEAEKQRQQEIIAQKKAELDSIAAQIREIRAEKKRKREEAKENGTPIEEKVVVSGDWTWPIPGAYPRVWDDFFIKNRIHPVFGEERDHDGLDCAAPTGTPIYAAKGGEVYIAYWYQGYGNCVAIDHGDGFSTIYGHCSSLDVSVGDVVNAGDLIARVGSTGWSDGPHLHFGVMINEVPVDPLNYVSY